MSDDGQRVLFVEAGSAVGRTGYSIYLGRTDGSPPIRLGEGLASALSPDGAWVAATVTTTVPQRMSLLPTAAGVSRVLDTGPVTSYEAVTWLPDGRVLFGGREPGHGTRLYVQDIQGGAPTAISPDGFRIQPFSRPVSPDGRWVIATDSENRVVLHPTGGGTSQPLSGLDPDEVVIRWGTDSKSLYMFRLKTLPAPVLRFHLSDHRREPVTEIAPSARAGVRQIRTIHMTPDGRRFVYSYSPSLSYLSLVENVR
jgi:hypothetical protein